MTDSRIKFEDGAFDAELTAAVMASPTLKKALNECAALGGAALRIDSNGAAPVVRVDSEAGGARAAASRVVAAELNAAILASPVLSAALGGTVRTDAEEKTPSKDVAPGDKNPKHGVDTEEEDGGVSKLLKVTDALTNLITGLSERLDAIEAKKKADEEEEPRKGRRSDQEKRDLPEPAAADSVGFFEPANESLFADVQARADAVYSAFAMNAAPPMSGERLAAYRRRLLRPLMHHSENFKDLDLAVASVSPVLFDKVEKLVYADAVKAAANPQVPYGRLQERKEIRNGHTHIHFFGSPSVWLDRHRARTRCVTAINYRPST